MTGEANVDLVERIRRGDRRALARAITLIENGAEQASALLARLDTGQRSHVVGVTGPPGAGKSTLVDGIARWYRSRQARVGVVAVDPSSPFSGGAVLGDRIRMQHHFLDPEVFIRSLSARGAMGGLARAARRVIRLMEAAGYDPVVVETVGVGQSELEIIRVADTVVVVLVPESGDTVQAMKAGLLEIGDVFVVNKADRPGADRLETELRAMLEQRPVQEWRVPVLRTIASQGEGVERLCEAIRDHGRFLDHARRRGSRRDARAEFLEALRQEIEQRLLDAVRNGRLDGFLRRIDSGELDPYEAARDLARRGLPADESLGGAAGGSQQSDGG